MKYAIIEKSLITNIVESDKALSDNWVELTGDFTIGDLYSDGAFSKLPVDLEELRSNTRDLVNSYYYTLINSPVEYKNNFYRGGESSLVSINGVLQRALRDNIEPQKVASVDDKLVDLTITEMTELTTLLFDTIKPLDEAMRLARVAVKEADSIEELEAIKENLDV